VAGSGRAVSETARAHGVSWWAVQAALSAALLVLPDVSGVVVKRLGVDEHRYRSSTVTLRHPLPLAWVASPVGVGSRSPLVRGRPRLPVRVGAVS